MNWIELTFLSEIHQKSEYNTITSLYKQWRRRRREKTRLNSIYPYSIYKKWWNGRIHWGKICYIYPVHYMNMSVFVCVHRALAQPIAYDQVNYVSKTICFYRCIVCVLISFTRLWLPLFAFSNGDVYHSQLHAHYGAMFIVWRSFYAILMEWRGCVCVCVLWRNNLISHETCNL